MRGSIICTLTFIPSTEEETKQAEFRRVNLSPSKAKRWHRPRGQLPNV
jgi:hypothetical protein